MPNYFFEIAASSTGKYHPSYSLGVGGLVRHTKAAVMIAHVLLDLEMYNRYSSDERDLMLVALILHDGFKLGKEEDAGKYTVAEHPKICSEWIKATEELNSMLETDQIDILCGCIESHMGQWNTNYKTKEEILPKPKTAAQKFVHMADYLASRKNLILDFGDDYYTPEEESTEGQSAKNNDILDELKAEIVLLCKSMIKNGFDRNQIYQIIQEHNNGVRNPNSIADTEVAKTIKNKLEELNIA